MINHNFLNSWIDNFISHDFEKFIIYSKNNHDEHEKYAADIDINNYENDL